MNQVKCKYHPKAQLIEDYTAGDLVCPVCGLVVCERATTENAEWRNFSGEIDHCRVGAVEYDELDPCCSSGIVNYNKDGKKYFNTAETGDVKIKLRVKKHVLKLASRLHIPKILTNQAMEIATKFILTKSQKKIRVEAFAAACLYISCIIHKVPRQIQDFLGVSLELTKKQIELQINRIEKHLKLDIIKKKPEAEDFIQIFANKLRISKDKDFMSNINIALQRLKLNPTFENIPGEIATVISIIMAAKRLNRPITKEEICSELDVKLSSVATIIKKCF